MKSISTILAALVLVCLPPPAIATPFAKPKPRPDLMVSAACPIGSPPGAVCACPGGEICDWNNGIGLDLPKTYDNRTLQLQLLGLATRLSQVSGVDQNALISRVGSLQGANTAQSAFNFQVLGSATPSVATTALTGTPSSVLTNGLTNNTGTSPSSSQTNSLVTTTPSNTVQTLTTAPSLAPSAPAASIAGGYANPTAFNVSSAEALAEEMQLSYQMVDLQLLMQGSAADDYSPSGRAKRHVTLGFPIDVEPPSRFAGAVAEVEVSVCNLAQRNDDAPVTLQNILPQEKTYNVAGLTSHSAGLSVGAVIAGVVNVGAGYSQSHQTFYLVKDRDTQAFRHRGPTSRIACPSLAASAAPLPANADEPGGSDPTIDTSGSAIADQPLTFGWQFRPTLGRRMVDGGLRPTFAQVSLAPSDIPPSGKPNPGFRDIQVALRTCWRKYDTRLGTVGDVVKKSCSPIMITMVRIAFDTTKIERIEQADNGDGTLNVKVYGSFPTGTQVAIGDAYVAIVDQVVERNKTFLRFTAPVQAAATHDIRIVSPDGAQQDVAMQVASSSPMTRHYGRNQDGQIYTEIDGPFPIGATLKVDGRPTTFAWTAEHSIIIPIAVGAGHNVQVFDPQGSEITCQPAPAAQKTTIRAVSASLSEVSFTPPQNCLERFIQDGAYPRIVVIGSKAYGLSDAPLQTSSLRQVKLLVPTSTLQGQSSLTYKRLFYGLPQTYALAPPSAAITSMAVFSTQPDAAKPGSTETTYLVTGTNLSQITIDQPSTLKGRITPVEDGDTMFLLRLSDADKAYQQLIFKAHDNTLIVQSLPTGGKVSLSGSVSLSATTAFTVTGQGAQLVTEIDYLGKPISFALVSGGATGPALAVVPAQGMTSAAGTVMLKAVLQNGDTAPIAVKVQ